MLLKCQKMNIGCFLAIIIYIFAIIQTLDTKYRYVMYFFSIVITLFYSACYYSSGKNHLSKFISEYKYLFLWVFEIILITLLANILLNDEIIKIGALIQPVFIFCCILHGYVIASKYGTDGVHKIVYYIYFILCIALAFGIEEYFSKRNIFMPQYGHDWWNAYRVASFLGHPIIFSCGMMCGFWISVLLVKSRWKVFMIIGFIFGIFAGQSRSIWGALVVSICLVLISNCKDKIKKKYIFYFAIVILLSIFFLCSPIGNHVIETIISRFSGVKETVAYTQRFGTIKLFLNDLKNNFNLFWFIFGHGEDMASQLLLETTISIKDMSATDNQYILIFYNYGVCVFIYIIIMLIKGAFLLIKNWRKMDNVLKCLNIIILSLAVASFFFELTEIKEIAFLFLLFVGSILGLKKHKTLKR